MNLNCKKEFTYRIFYIIPILPKAYEELIYADCDINN